MKSLYISALTLLAISTTASAQFVVTPKEGEPTVVNGNISFSAQGEEWSVGESFNPDMELSKIASISLSPKEESAKVGDYFYSDGSYSSTLDESKKPIGIVFYVGNPSVNDAALRAAFPGCVHGLVLALKDTKCEWQEDYSGFEDEADMTVGEWIEDNTDYVSIATRSVSMTSVFNQIMGFNNTKGIDKFNDSDYGWDYEVIVGNKISSPVSSTPAPTSTSGWYVPSIKEVSLFVSGAIDGNIDDLGYESEPDNANVVLINEKLKTVAGSTLINGVYWSSTEYSVGQAYTVQSANGLVMSTSKGGSNNLRPVLAF